MAQRRKNTSVPASASQTSVVVYGIVIVVTVFVVLAVVRYYPSTSADGLPIGTTQTEPLNLPVEAVVISAEEMRQETEEHISTLIMDYPNSVVPRKIAAEFALSTNRYDDARSHWESALKIDPQAIDAEAGLAKLDIEQGHPEQAVERLAKFLPQHASNLDLSTEYARGLQQMGKLEQAAQIANAALLLFPHDISLLETAAEIESQRGQLESARMLCERGLQLNPSNGSLHFLLSNVSRRLGNAELADNHLQISRELRPKTQTGASGFEQQYDRSLRQIVSLALAQAAEFYLDQGDADHATKLALRATEIYPQGGSIYRVLSKVLYRQDRFADAYQVERRLVTIEPNNPINYVNLSKIAFLAGDPTGGKEALLLARKQMPGSPTIATALAAFYLEDGDFNNARKLAEESVRMQPSFQAYQVLSAACAGMRDQAGQAEADRHAQQLMKPSRPVDPASN